MIPTDYAPRELISSSYSDIERCVSPLTEIAKVNPGLVQEVIELAIVIGINAAYRRQEKDRLHTAIKQETGRSGFRGY